MAVIKDYTPQQLKDFMRIAQKAGCRMALLMGDLEIWGAKDVELRVRIQTFSVGLLCLQKLC